MIGAAGIAEQEARLATSGELAAPSSPDNGTVVKISPALGRCDRVIAFLPA